MLKHGLAISFIFFIACNASAQKLYRDDAFYLKLKDSCQHTLDYYLTKTGSRLQENTFERPFKGLSKQMDKTYRVSSKDIKDAITTFNQYSFIEYAEPIPIDYTTFYPDDVQGEQYNLGLINAFQAWDITRGDTNITIAIVDNAVRYTHEDIAPNRWTNYAELNGLPGVDDDLNGYVDDIYGYDPADLDGDPAPPGTTTNNSPFIHGTHVAGIASGSTNNTTGMASLGYNVRLMSVKASADTSDGNSIIAGYEGILYAANAGADVINMSWGSTESSQTNQNFINAIAQMGIVLVAAAGNNGSDNEFYPAAYDNVIAVGNTNKDDVKVSFSNYGDYIDVMAPGKFILSAFAEDDISYGLLGGTSMSSPHVAGLAGLVLSVDPTLTPTEVEELIEKGCDNIDLNNFSFVGELGAGRINAYKTLSFVIEGTFPNDFNPLWIYPNPSVNGDLTITTTDSLLVLTEVIIYDVTGRPVITVSLDLVNSTSLPISNNLPSGAYVIEATLQTGHQFRRIWNLTYN